MMPNQDQRRTSAPGIQNSIRVPGTSRTDRAAVMPGVVLALLAMLGAGAPGAASASAALPPAADLEFDLLLKGGRVIDPRNQIDEPRDVAIWGGRVVRVAPEIDGSQARRVVSVEGLIVVPGLVDLHTHVYSRSGSRLVASNLSVTPDTFAPRSGTTTVVDAGTSGWRTFLDFKDRVIDRSRTRVLAFLNIVGRGMNGRPFEQLADDMDPTRTAEMALRFPETIVGIKTAHYDGPEWIAVERAVAAGKLARIPVMVDFGTFRPERPFEQLVLEKLRPGDIATHMYLDIPGYGTVPLLDSAGKLLPYLAAARQRGIRFDLGHGFESFPWAQVVPAVRQGWLPDTISTDIYARSINSALQDMPTAMSKFLALGVPLKDVVAMATWKPAQCIRRDDLGHLSAGAEADVAVLAIRTGRFGLLDVRNLRLEANQRLECELTLRGGKVVWDLNGRAADPWDESNPRRNEPRVDYLDQP
jgi:dihydroorotase